MPHCARVGANGAIYPDSWVAYPNCQSPGYVLYTSQEAQQIYAAINANGMGLVFSVELVAAVAALWAVAFVIKVLMSILKPKG